MVQFSKVKKAILSKYQVVPQVYGPNDIANI